MGANELTALTVAEAADRIRAKELSPLDLTEAYLDRITALDGRINAYITVTAERAREDARRAADEVVRGSCRGPLHGVPIGLKDLYDTAGILTTAGAKVHADRVPAADSTAARKLRDAGSVLLGKLNTHEFAWGATTNNPHYGPTHNPWDLSRVPGGSSGGSGAAIAAGLAAATLGTDTGGSIRIPASLCGCVGFKPTFGRVSKAGVIPMSWVFDHPGPITQTVEDAAIVLQAIAGYDPHDPMTVNTPVPDYRAALRGGLAGMKIGLLRGYFADSLDAEVALAMDAAADQLRELGAELRDVDAGLDRETMGSAFTVVIAEGQEYHAPQFTAHKEDFGRDLQAVLTTPLPDAVGLTAAYRLGYEINRTVRLLLEEVDLLLAATTPIPAPSIGQEFIAVAGNQVGVSNVLASLTMPFNATGMPALALPCGFTAGGLPIGMQFVGKPFDEPAVLRAAHAYEQATGWHKRRPSL